MRKKIILILAIFLLPSLFINLNKARSDNLPVLLVFHSPGCHRCVELKKTILPQIEKEFKGKTEIRYYDTTDIKNYTFLIALKEKFDKNIELALPVFFFNGNFINGKGDVKGNLERLLSASLAGYNEEEVAGVDLLTHFKGFKPLAIIGAGLTDGINPCAFTVIVFFISYLALQGYRKLELIIIGLTFIFAVFLAYLLIGLGIFNFLYRLEGFWILSKAFNIAIGIFSLILGILAIYDLLKFNKDRDTEGQILQLPQAIKNRIHSIIGMYYRKSKETDADGINAPRRLAKLVLSALITGFLVSILEAVCTGQLYLPAISFILKTTPLKLQAFGYLLTYNIMFIAPLFIIFLLALFGVNSSVFAKFIRRHMVSIKLFMAIAFISLGVFLIWRG